LAQEQHWRELFRENVSWQWDFERASGRYEGNRPREQWDKFYEPFRKRRPLDISSNEVVGWFEH
jgi:hypothetical protein